jgi:pilus assembly protein TadC
MSLRALRWMSACLVLAACVTGLGIDSGLLAATVATPLALTVTTRLHTRPERVRAAPYLALTLDLVAVALRAGQPLAAALLIAAPAATGTSGEHLARVGGLLRLGADPMEVWREAADDPVLFPVAAAARRSATSGIRLAAGFEQVAREMRLQLRAAATARAERVGVFAAAPLGLCFLPAFVCLGIAPIVVGIADKVVHGGI